MNILVVNGSPKGKYSITLQTINYLKLLYTDHNFEVLDAGQRIKALERDFTPAVQALEKADLIIFSYPVYTFIAPYQLHRFIELIKENNISVEGRFATQLSTSKHFYDVTAHRYIQDNCGDLGLKYIRGLSADMDDLTTDKGQKEAKDFFEYVLFCVNNNIFERNIFEYTQPKHTPVTTLVNNTAEKTGDVVILTNCEENDRNIQNP